MPSLNLVALPSNGCCSGHPSRMANCAGVRMGWCTSPVVMPWPTSLDRSAHRHHPNHFDRFGKMAADDGVGLEIFDVHGGALLVPLALSIRVLEAVDRPDRRLSPMHPLPAACTSTDGPRGGQAGPCCRSIDRWCLSPRQDGRQLHSREPAVAVAGLAVWSRHEATIVAKSRLGVHGDLCSHLRVHSQLRRPHPPNYRQCIALADLRSGGIARSAS